MKSSQETIIETKTLLTKKPLLIIFIIIIILIFLSPSLYFYYKFQQAQQLLQNVPSGSKGEIIALVEKVGKLIELPSDEEPTIATVTDLEKLKDQPFFAKAKIGDKVLIYNKAKKAILYDPVTNKVIEVGPLVIASPNPAVSVSPSLPPALSSSPASSPSAVLSPAAAQTSSFSIVLYNGTDTNGLTKTVERELKDYSAYQVASKDYAAKTDYSKTLVIDLAGNKSEEAEKLAKIVGGEVSLLPKGEIKPQADFLVIAGENKK